MLWGGREPFFPNLKTFLGKWTFINVHFLKKSFKSKKTMHMHISSISVPSGTSCSYGVIYIFIILYMTICDHTLSHMPHI